MGLWKLSVRWLLVTPYLIRGLYCILPDDPMHVGRYTSSALIENLIHAMTSDQSNCKLQVNQLI
jgi:hypothetical protein